MDKFADVLQGIADKLGVAAIHLWPEMVRYTWAQAVGQLVVTALAVLGLALYVQFLLPRMIRDWRAPEGTLTNEETSVCLIVTFVGVVLGLFAIATLAGVSNSVATVLAPEGATISKLLEKK